MLYMGTALFVWLGSGRARRRKVTDRGVYLDRAAQAGLPVPPGAVLLQELYETFTAKGLVESRQGRAFIPDPELLHNTLFYSVRLPRFTRPVTFDSLFAPETGPLVTAGAAASSHLPVDMNDPGEVARALATLWSDAPRRPDSRADILLLEWIEAEMAGRACSLAADETDRVEVAGQTQKQTLPRMRGWLKPTSDMPPSTRRLQMLLGGVRRTFGRGDWVIDWADDGEICWLRDLSVVTAVTNPTISQA
jgi:pyruvate,water dikinase